jgi:FkbM family methyltransferase
MVLGSVACMKIHLKKAQRALKAVPGMNRPLALVEHLYRKSRGAIRSGAAVLPGFRLITSGSVVVELSEFNGRFELDARSDLFRRILAVGSFEPEAVAKVRSVLKLRKGDCVDVGANVGFYSVLFAGLVPSDRRVLAIEPVPSVQEYLSRNLTRNGCDESVHVFRGAAGRVHGTLALDIVPGKEEYSSASLAHASVRGMNTISITVPVAPLDSIVQEHNIKPVLIKIDVEGSEVDVLLGAQQTLREHRPHLLMEFAPNLLEANGTSGQQMLQVLKDAGYKVEWVSDVELLAHPPSQ